MSAFPDAADHSTTLGGPEALTLPEGWTCSTSWKRAQSPGASKNPLNAAEWVVQIDDGEFHRVTFAIEDGDLVADCDCTGWAYHDWCAHVALLWWDWTRGRAIVDDLDTGRRYELPPAWLSVDRGGEQ